MNKKPPFIQYWFVWNGWGTYRVRGREAKCCHHCRHYDDRVRCTEGACEYCKLHDIQVRGELVCDYHIWKDGSESMWEKDIVREELMERENDRMANYRIYMDSQFHNMFI